MKDNDSYSPTDQSPGPAKNKDRKGVSHVKTLTPKPRGQAVSHVKTVAEFATRLAAAWHRSVDGIIEAGRIWAEAKDTLSPTELKELMATTRFSGPTVSKLISIAKDRRITDPNNQAVLPNSYGSLYELRALNDADFESAVREGVLRPDIERDDVLALTGKHHSRKAKAKKAVLVTILQKQDEIRASDLKALESAVLAMIDLSSFVVEVSPAYKGLVKRAK
jgi:hypothetical protein